jgi:hypothetical protein
VSKKNRNSFPRSNKGDVASIFMLAIIKHFELIDKENHLTSKKLFNKVVSLHNAQVKDISKTIH